MDFKEKYRQMNERIVPSPAVIRALTELPARKQRRLGWMRGAIPAAVCICLALTFWMGHGVKIAEDSSKAFLNNQAPPPEAGVKEGLSGGVQMEEKAAAEDDAPTDQGSLEKVELRGGTLYLNRKPSSDRAETVLPEMNTEMKTMEEAVELLGIPEGMLPPELPADLQEDGLFSVQMDSPSNRAEFSYRADGEELRSVVLRFTAGDSLRKPPGTESLISGVQVWAFYEPGLEGSPEKYSAEFRINTVSCQVETESLTRAEFTALLESLLMDGE